MGQSAHLCGLQGSCFRAGKSDDREGVSGSLSSAWPSECSVNPSTRAVLFNAIPLLIVAVTYFAGAASLAPQPWGERARTKLIDLVPALTFPAYAVAAAIWGIVTLVERRPLAGHVWASLAGLVLA